ncbi:hypothetical protein [Sphingomonas sp.]|uniref:hypothetical protein n=1 Tax=Sphingomonas sp. TaxID=28214 RepID=UPI002C3A7515|nr:hypothetical protein [Sphingomonas sp.]HWK36859.1 hypothetical protein [Sphingomonas sp.]
MAPPDRPDDTWFAAKRYGFGIGRPVVWQGWALLAGYMLALAAAGAALAERHHMVFVVVALLLTAAMIVIAAGHTQGGMRWRWGKED